MEERSKFIVLFKQNGTNMHTLHKSMCLQIIFLLVLTAANASIIPVSGPDSFSIEGRWDMTLSMDGKSFPSWLQVKHSGFHTLVGEWVGVSGSTRPISKVNYSGSKISFSLPPQWEQGTNDLIFEGSLQGDSLTGTVIFPDGKNYNWTAVRAPMLRRNKPPVWGTPVRMFNGTNLKGWHAMGDNQWKAEGGILRSPKS